MGRTLRCIVSGCGTTNRTENKELFPIPEVKRNSVKWLVQLTERRRQLWFKQLELKEDSNITGCVCADHFVSGKPAPYPLEEDVDWSPTKNLTPTAVAERDSRLRRILPKPAENKEQQSIIKTTASTSSKTKMIGYNNKQRSKPMKLILPSNSDVPPKSQKYQISYKKKEKTVVGKLDLKRIEMSQNGILSAEFVSNIQGNTNVLKMTVPKRISPVTKVVTLTHPTSFNSSPPVHFGSKLNNAVVSQTSRTVPSFQTPQQQEVGTERRKVAGIVRPNTPNSDHNYCLLTESAVSVASVKLNNDHDYCSKSNSDATFNCSEGYGKLPEIIDKQVPALPMPNGTSANPTEAKKSSPDKSPPPHACTDMNSTAGYEIEFILPDVASRLPQVTKQEPLPCTNHNNCAIELAFLKSQLKQKTSDLESCRKDLHLKTLELDFAKEQVISLRAQLEENAHALCAYLASEGKSPASFMDCTD